MLTAGQFQSVWIGQPDKENSLVTTVLDGEMVTIFNGLLVVHGSSNRRSANKLHEEVKKDLVQQLKDGFAGLFTSDHL